MAREALSGNGAARSGTASNLEVRTKAFALRVIEFVNALPHDRTVNVIGKQLLRSATPVGANYRAACRAKSPADFIAKMKIVEEECTKACTGSNSSWRAVLLGETSSRICLLKAMRLSPSL